MIVYLEVLEVALPEEGPVQETVNGACPPPIIVKIEPNVPHEPFVTSPARETLLPELPIVKVSDLLQPL